MFTLESEMTLPSGSQVLIVVVFWEEAFHLIMHLWVTNLSHYLLMV